MIEFIKEKNKYKNQFNLMIKIFCVLLIVFSISANAQDFWISGNGPETGSIQAMVVTPAGQILAGTDGGGIFRSINNGDQWDFAALPNVDVQSFLVDSMGHVYAGTAQGIYKSDDNGINWSESNNGLTSLDVTSLVVGWNNLIYAGTYDGGIFKSDNSGNNWTQVNNNLVVLSLSENSQGHIFAGTEGDGVYRSTDEGATWTRINVGLTELEVVALTVNWNFDIIIAGTHNGVFRSTDNGSTWVAVNNGLIALDILSLDITQQGQVIAGTYEGIYRSDNDGDNWFAVNHGLTNTIIKSFTTKDLQLIFTGTAGGVFRSSDFGSNWGEYNIGLNASIVRSLVCKDNGVVLAGTEGGGLFRSTDVGTSWGHITNGISNPFILSLAVNSNGVCFAGTYEGVFRSTDNGDSWTQVNTNLTNTDVYALAINGNDAIFAGTAGGVFRSASNGDNWQRINSGLTNLDVNALVVSSSDVIFAACDSGGFFRSTNNGDSWSLQNSGLSATDVLSLTINSSDNLFAGTYDGVFRSNDAGNNWEIVNNGLTSTDIFSLQVDHVDKVFCGTYDGAFVSANNGDLWNQINTGLTNLDIFSFALHPGGYMFAGSYGGSAFRSRVNISLDAPQLEYPIDASSDLSLTPELSWHSVSNATGYKVDVATDYSFIDIVFSDNLVSTNTFCSTLEAGTNYFWRVNAVDVLNTSYWSETWRFTTRMVPTCTTQAPSDITPVSATLNAMVNPNNVKVGVGFEYGLDSNYGNYIIGSPDTLANASGNPVSARVLELVPDTRYHFRVIARNADFTIESFGDDLFFDTGRYPVTIDLSTTVDFPQHGNLNEYQASDYRLVGLPGISDLNVDELMVGQHGVDWDLYWDNGADSDYFVRWDGSYDFKFFSGKAYWLIKRGSWNVNETGVYASNINSNYEALISLHSGWNLITNPFESPLNWEQIQNRNGITEPLWGFDGNYFSAQFFVPYNGYYFYNNTGLSDLIIPYQLTLQKPVQKTDYIWLLGIELSIGENIDRSAKIGVSENAEIGKDELDYHKPRAFGNLPSVYFSKPEWDASYSTFASDIRPPVDEIEYWEFSVSAQPHENAKLVIKNVAEVSDKFEVILLDRANSKYVNLRKDNSYQFNPVTEITNFELLVGDKKYIDQEISEIIPQEFALGRNFPNPFNPSTVIPISIPNVSELTLKVYNVLGQEIKTLFKGTKEAGKHYFKWDGTNYLNQQVAAGIYLYRLNADNGQNFVGKMVLVK